MRRTYGSGWHRADIIAAVHKSGTNLRRLATERGFGESTLRAALHKRHPRANLIIAEVVGVPAYELWPAWFSSPAADSEKPRKRGVAA